MKEIFGMTNKVLEVDLSNEKNKIYDISEDERRLYLGAKGLGLKLLFDRMEPGIDPLGEENIIAFMPGVLMGTGAPCSGRFHAVTKSPLTGIMVTASCGGSFGMQLKTAGWDGLLIKGIARRPIYLEINSDEVKFKDAEHLWGKDTVATQEELKEKKAGVLAIGPAGENLVRFSNIASDQRFLGRGGMGAVMGSKNLKAIVAIGGTYKVKPKEYLDFEKAKKKGNNYINRNYTTSVLYRNFGTSSTVNISNAAKILPVNNFSSGSHEHAHEISGETMSEKHQTKHHTCKPCTILCGHIGTFDNKKIPVPEFETVGLLGSNLGVFDANKIAEWNRICSDMGMDTISTGGTLGWVMEATQKGLIKTNLQFGSPEGVSEAIYDIAYGRNFGKEMALGTRFLSKKYGGEDFAIQVKGLEIAAYDPRGAVGQGLAYAVANRGGCHLSSYMVSLEVLFKLLNPNTTLAKPEFTVFFEALNCAVNSIQTCQFTTLAYLLEPPLSKYTPPKLLGFFMQYSPKIALKLMDFSLYTELWTSVTGIKMSNSKFLEAGNRIHILERYMNTREGISKKDDTLPDRFLNESRKDDPKGYKVPLEKMLKKYYKLRGYDSNGIPSEKTLKRFKII
ncbi:MAG: aldehyde ferredoxin oxidoreductase family protein [Desulfobacterales bacterium]|nr:aldehyde ferredoxin oxidoreductase family protein [Desulfobacterales bacterium]